MMSHKELAPRSPRAPRGGGGSGNSGRGGSPVTANPVRDAIAERGEQPSGDSVLPAAFFASLLLPPLYATMKGAAFFLAIGLLCSPAIVSAAPLCSGVTAINSGEFLSGDALQVSSFSYLICHRTIQSWCMCRLVPTTLTVNLLIVSPVVCLLITCTFTKQTSIMGTDSWLAAVR